MKKVTLAVVSIITGLSLSAVSVSSQAMDRQVEHALIKVCKSALSNKPIRLKHTISDYHLKTRDVALKVVCNGEDIITFAENHGAHKTAIRLQKSVGNVDIIDVAAQHHVTTNISD